MRLSPNAVLDRLQKQLPGARPWYDQATAGAAQQAEHSLAHSLGQGQVPTFSDAVQSLNSQVDAANGAAATLDSYTTGQAQNALAGRLWGGTSDDAVTFFNAWVSPSANWSISGIGAAGWNVWHLDSIPDASFFHEHPGFETKIEMPVWAFPSGSFEALNTLPSVFSAIYQDAFFRLNDYRHLLNLISGGRTEFQAAVSSLVARVQTMTEQAERIQKNGTRAEVVLLSGSVALGLGAVFFGSVVGAEAAAIAATVAEFAGANTAGLVADWLSNAVGVGKGASSLSALEDIRQKLGDGSTDLPTVLDDALTVSGTSDIVLRLAEMLSKCSLMIEDKEVMLLSKLGAEVAGRVVPLSDALKGAVYQDSSGYNRHALLTLLLSIYHLDFEPPP